MQTLTAARVLSGQRRGSSRPVLVATEAGPRIVKLRGAAQGTGPLIAEVIVAALAEAIDLRVPARSLVEVAPDIPSDDRDGELRDLLAASAGTNLGFTLLEGARDATPEDLARVTPAEMAAALWLDGFVLNLDRTRRNPNILWWRDRMWLVDHGAALRFQYDWPAVTEGKAREAGWSPEPHVFAAAAASPDWPTWDAAFAARLTREVLEAAVQAVPASFLLAMMPPSTSATALHRRRAAYLAFLWKRLQSPRAFAAPAPPSTPL